MLPKPLAMPAALVALVVPALAQQSAPGGSAAGSIARSAPITQVLPNADENSPTEVKEFASGQLGGSFTARDFIDKPLYDTAGNEIGPIVDLGIDETGDVSLVVVGVGNGDEQGRRIAFDFEHLAYQTTDDSVRIVANIKPEDVENAPPFNSLADAAALRDQAATPASGR